MDDLSELFKKIEDNIFDTQNSKEIPQENIDLNIPPTTKETNTPKKSKNIINTEIKENRASKLHLETIEKDEIKEDSNEEKEKIIPTGDEYSDYARIDKKGIHFQIISDINVSIEIVPDTLLTTEVKDLIIKYKGVFDSTMKLWLLPYVNYQSLYTQLFQIESLRNKLHKVGSIAQEYYQNKSLKQIIIRRKKEDEILDYTTDTKERNPDELPEKIKKSLYNFQAEGIKFGISHHCRFLLADEMGVGKTLQAISLAYIYRDSWPVLVVCPGSMKYNWRGEIQTWLGLKNHRISIINSSRQKISQEAYFYIISYDLMRNVIKKMRQMTFDFVILDEAHSIKNKDSLRAKNILPIAVRAKRLIIMTGTPLLAKPYEGYPLLYALRPDIFCYFKKYAYRYCDPQPTPMGINWSGTSNTKELHWILSCLMVRRLKRDVLNQLPPKRRQKIEISTDENLIKEIAKKKSEVKGRKGTLECYTLTSKAKIEGVKEYISDIIDAKEKFIVFAYHHDMLNSLEELCKKKNVEYIRIDGNTKQETRYLYVNYFQQNPKCQVAILSIIAASTGITLTAAHMVIFAELTWTPSIMIQAEDRVHRIGQKGEFVDIKYLYGKETLDDFILDKLQKKLTIVSTTLDDKKEFLGVKADPNLVHVNEGLTSKDLIEKDVGEFYNNEEVNPENLEKKMMDDLDLETDEKRNKGEKKRRNKRNISKNIKRSKTNTSKLSINSNSKNKDFRFPKESKKSSHLTKKKIENGTKISIIKELRKLCTSANKPKSANKQLKKEMLDEDFSKRAISTFINYNKNKLREGLNNINNLMKKMDSIEKKVAKEKVNTEENININDNTNNDFDYYEKSLLVNLHKTNKRRTTIKEETKNIKNSKIKLIEPINNQSIEETKKMIILKNKDNKDIFNGNKNENISQNNKTTLI